MRGSTGPQIRLATPEQLVPRDHPTPQIKPIVGCRPAPARPRLRDHVLRPGQALDPARDQASLGAKASLVRAHYALGQLFSH